MTINESHLDEVKDLKRQIASLEKLSEQYSNAQFHHRALYKITQLASECTEIALFYPEVHKVVASLMNANNFYIALLDSPREHIEFVYHVDEIDTVPEGPIPLSFIADTMTWHTLMTGEAILATPELIAEMIEQKIWRSVGAHGVDWLGVPLVRDNAVIGVMVVQSYTESLRYDEEDKKLLLFAGQHIVTALMRFQDRERLQREVDERTKELREQISEREKSELLQESLFRISELTSQNYDIDRFYGQLHNIIGQLLSASNFYIANVDEEAQQLHFVYYSDQLAEDPEKEFQSRPLSKGLTEYALRQGKTVLLDRPTMQKLDLSGEVKMVDENTHSWLGVPMVRGGKIFGVMAVQSYDKEIDFTEKDAELLNFVSHHVITAIERRETAEYQRRSHEILEQTVQSRTQALEEEIRHRKKIEQQLKHTATHDALTGLPNRMYFTERLAHAIARRRRHPDENFAVLFLDLDRFKVVNDSLGHHAGDQLLKFVAGELKQIIRDIDIVARLGGDEFVILVEDLQNEDEATYIASRVIEMLKLPITLENQPVFVGTSIGILYSEDRYDTAEDMLRDADAAMYQAKANGKGRAEVFDTSMHQEVMDALNLEADIRSGIENSEFEPYFQPIYDLEANKIVGFEALARWHSPKRGIVMPGQFIVLAEETGLITQLDSQILSKAVVQLKQWHRMLGDESLYISSNCHCSHFFAQDFPAEVRQLLEDYQLKPWCLRLELTERALFEDTEQVLVNMQQLKRLGVQLLLDDFGTGYSSLSYLYRFPIDMLKIDRSFVCNMNESDNNRAIIKTIIDLAKNLNMKTVGEGIESESEVEILSDMGCHYGQGFHLARPMPAEQVSELLDAQRYLQRRYREQQAADGGGDSPMMFHI